MTSQEFRRELQRIEELVRAIESAADPNARASAIELTTALMQLHGAAISRIVEIASASDGPGAATVAALAEDETVASLLLLYDLHPVPFEDRVQRALESVRPLLASHGGNVVLLGTGEGVVRLRLDGSCHGCGSSASTLKLAIEEAIYQFAPDLVALEVEGVVAEPQPDRSSGLVQLGRTKPRGPGATTIGPAAVQAPV